MHRRWLQLLPDTAGPAELLDSEPKCSILHSQQVLGTLELFFRTAVGCNSYLTPPGQQGFAPHSDDIDAFILQLEGSKRCGNIILCLFLQVRLGLKGELTLLCAAL